MSVAAQQSPHHGAKRLLETLDSPEQSSYSTGKRTRYAGSPGGRCAPLSERQANVAPAGVIQALKGLFPEMDERVVDEVLVQCGSDIDSAIKRLSQLRLASQQQAPQPQGAQNGHESAAGTGQGSLELVRSNQPDSSASGGPSSSVNWVETLVQQMQAARTLDDARVAAGKLLQAFEQAVLASERSKGGGQELEAVKGHLQEAMRENTILKRAVQIQNTRMQEMATREQQASHQASQDSLQMQQLKQMVVQYQAKIQQLEMNNYKMTMHIRNADAAARQGSNRFPDVF